MTQETFLSVYRSLATFDRQHEKAWVCRIATNKCLDYLKSSKRESIPTEESYFELQKATDPSPEETLLQNEVKTHLLKRCNDLKEPYCEVALDYFYNEMTAMQIATKTGKNLKTIQTQIYRAKAMLQKKYRKGAHYIE